MAEKLNFKINAAQAVKEFGKSLIGEKVVTFPYGGWPGGPCEVIALNLDENAPEIVLQVKALFEMPQRAVELEVESEVGVFDHENIIIDEESLRAKRTAAL